MVRITVQIDQQASISTFYATHDDIMYMYMYASQNPKSNHRNYVSL